MSWAWQPIAVPTPGTRFYLPSSGAAAVSPAFDAAWEETGSTDRIKMVTTRISSAMTDKSITTLITAGDALSRQYVSDGLAAQTINGYVKVYARAFETLGTVDAVSRIVVKVVSSDGSTIRGTLLAFADYSTGAEWNTSLRNKAFADGDTPSSVSAQDGDRLVLEIGFNHAAVISSATINFGDDSATDLAENETDTAANNPWLEIGQTLTFSSGGTTYNDSVSVSRKEAVSDRMTNNISPLILLSQRDGVSDGMNNSIPKNSSLNTVLSIIDTAGVGIYPSLTLGQRVAFVPANIALVGGSVSIGQALGLIDVPRLDAQASLAFLEKLGINLSSALSTNQVEAVLALAERLGLNTSTQLNSFPLVGIGERLFLVDANNANMLGSNVLSEIRAFNVSGGLAFQGSVAIGIDLDLLTSKLVSIFKSVQISEALGISDSVRANMQAAVSLGERSGMGSLVNQLLNAGLSINVVGSILTISGTDVMIVKGFVFTSDSAKNSLSTSDFSKSSIETGDS